MFWKDQEESSDPDIRSEEYLIIVEYLRMFWKDQEGSRDPDMRSEEYFIIVENLSETH